LVFIMRWEAGRLRSHTHKTVTWVPVDPVVRPAHPTVERMGDMGNSSGSERRGPFTRDYRRRAVIITASLAVFAIAPTAVAVHGFEITIPVETVVRAEEGSVTVLATEIVPEHFLGQSCSVIAKSENQGSVHPGNDLVVESGSSLVLLPDVEAEPGGTVTAQQDLVLGDEIAVMLIMGPDEVFSAGIDVHVECQPNDTTTTTTMLEETTTTSVPETTTTTVEGTTTTTVDDEVMGTEVTTTTTGASTSSTTEDEVLGTEVLPFTGIDGELLGLFVVALLASGALVLVGARKTID
jgi:hypothetical protein